MMPQIATMLAGGFSPPAVSFSGTAWLSRGADLTGAADGKVGTFCTWVNFQGGDGVQQNFGANTNPNTGIALQRQAAGTFRLFCRNSAGTLITNVASVATVTTASGWANILCAWDLAAATVQIYINDASSVAAGTIVDDMIDYTEGEWSVAASPDGANICTAYFSDYYLNLSTFIDLSVTANRRKFISPALKPVYLGANGSAPTGTQPILFLSGTASNYATNKGSGGGFTTNGSLSNAPSSP